MLDISIVIVNYNVKHFLDQCLRSVLDAVQDLRVEILVVDNDSIDGSTEHIKAHFPEVHLFENKENVGFAKANNKAIRVAKGKYILLLNPDTIIEKETLSKCFLYMESHEKCGALGVKMIDGEGKFLPESKRGFPTPSASLMRLSGLSRLFPKSRFFNGYNLGYMSENETNEIDVLCGAFMFIRKKALDDVGLLDEAFFMYGEDIDLSYRIQKGGYSIIYFPESTIVHFKGESTKKSSLKYYNSFYKAMAIFATKHFGGKMVNPFLWLINLAIVVIGVSSFLWRNARTFVLPILEVALFYGILQLVELTWAFFYYHDPGYYDHFDSRPVYLIYSAIWVMGLWLGGSYRSNMNIKRLFWGIVGGSIMILIVYALMDNSLRHSRAIILLSSIGIFFLSLLLRYLYNLLFTIGTSQKTSHKRRVLVVGDQKTIDRARDIMSSNHEEMELIGALATGDEFIDGVIYIQHLDRIEQVIEVFKVDEVLFSQENVPMAEIMQWMTKLGSKVRIKIISRNVQSIIGSHDRNSKGDLYTVEMKYKISLSHNRYLKFIIDYSLAAILISLSPLIVLLTLDGIIFKRLAQVILRKRSWVSYFDSDHSLTSLPKLLPGIVPPIGSSAGRKLSQEEMHSINYFYAKDFSAAREMEIILLNLKGIVAK